MTANLLTESETVFEQYLREKGLQWNRVEPTQEKQPDYHVEHDGKTCFFEVKEFDDPLKKAASGDPCPAIREKITQARTQFKNYGNHCCVLVLWNSKSVFRCVYPDVVASAAFGQFIHSIDSATENLRAHPPAYRFSGPAKLTASQNTTISAIAILSPYRLNHLWLDVWRAVKAKQERGEEVTPADQFGFLQRFAADRPVTYSHEGTIRTIVLENPYARVPFPSDMFRGPFDQRWSMDSGWLRVTFIGSELERMRQDGVPFTYV